MLSTSHHPTTSSRSSLLRSTTRSNEENAVPHPTTAKDRHSKKTPHSSRRAFGDISNRSNQNAAAAAPKPERSVVVVKPQQKTVTQTTTPAPPPHWKPYPLKRVGFIRPDSTVTEAAPKEAAPVQQEQHVWDEIELPAGRTWRQQQQELDDSSVELSLEGHDQVWENYQAIVQERHEAERQEERDAIARGVAALDLQVQAFADSQDAFEVEHVTWEDIFDVGSLTDDDEVSLSDIYVRDVHL